VHAARGHALVGSLDHHRDPFRLQDIYWSSATSLFEPDWAWALYMEKGATGVGQKRFAQLSVWAVATFD